MLKIVYTTQFKKDYKKLSKTGYDLTKINCVISDLADNKNFLLNTKTTNYKVNSLNTENAISNLICC